MYLSAIRFSIAWENGIQNPFPFFVFLFRMTLKNRFEFRFSFSRYFENGFQLRFSFFVLESLLKNGVHFRFCVACY